MTSVPELVDAVHVTNNELPPATETAGFVGAFGTAFGVPVWSGLDASEDPKILKAFT